MMKYFVRLSWLLAISAFASLATQAQTPTIAADGIRNGASYTIAGLPNSGVAQGSIFVIFGDNLGPASIVQVSSFPLPTSGGLAGTSVRVTVGSTSVNAIMLYTLKTQVAATLPSNTPVGTGTVTVTYNGATSNSAPITVLAGSWGSFTRNQAGTGPTIIQNFNSQANQPFNTLLEAARPNQVVTLWGTGLGPVSGDEAGSALPGNLANVNVRVFVGGREAAVQYRGRSGCCVGIDQIVFTVPDGVSGCSVPISVQVGNVASNFTSMSIAPNGGLCSDPQFSQELLEQARNTGSVRLGSLSLNKNTTRLQIPGLGNIETKSDAAAGAFIRYTLDGLLANANELNVSTPGACAVSITRISSTPVPPPPSQGLNAGSPITVSGPNGTKNMPQTSTTGFYSAVLSQSSPFGANEPDFLVPGVHTFRGPGGADVGVFNANLTVPPGVAWSNEAQVSTVVRASGQLVTWTGGDPNGFTYISGSSINVANTAQGTFVCIERTSAGSFTVPSAVLLALPPSGNQAGVPSGFFFVGTISNPERFSAPGLDAGYTTFTSSFAKNVSFQ